MKYLPTYSLFGAFVVLCITLAYYGTKYDYKSWPDIPGKNCINIDTVERPVIIIELGDNNLNILHEALQP